MKYPAHVVGGLTFGIAANQYIIQHLPIIEHQQLSPIMISGLFIAGSVFGSLLPDIDHRGSYLGRRLPVLSFLANATMGHRGATHAPFITVALTTLCALATHYFLDGIALLFCLTLLAGCMIGALSHIFLDSLTKSGVPLLFPLSKKHYRLASLKTGGIGEILVTFLMILIAVLISTGNFSTGLKSLLQ
ncbi:metal-dependent hydrolase [Brevibacillus sp. NPDC058079]|uniref:metal-dependent hydrolase n=1 Tax=Brevibacillus sp. NPDC058079 TaxID=3346330 RepID=UPI0036F06E2F